MKLLSFFVKAKRDFLLFVPLVIFLSACSTSLRKSIPFFETSLIENQPILRPIRAISSFDDSLSCMDAMLKQKGIEPVNITSKIIPDASGKVYVSIKDMIITALSKMSRSSNIFRYVDFETDPLKQDTVQNLSTILLNSGYMNISPPSLYVSGALVHLDQNVITKNSGFGIASDDFELALSGDLIATNLGLELHLGDFFTRTLIPGMHSANEAVIAGTGIALDTGGLIRKAGIQFSINTSYNQGVGPATRALVDLGIIELVGKWAEVPYWQCLALNQSHPEFQRQIYTWYEKLSKKELIELVIKIFNAVNYYDGDEKDGMTASLRESIINFQKDEGIVITGDINFETYDRIMRHYVTIDNNGKFVRIGWDKKEIQDQNDAILPYKVWDSPFSDDATEKSPIAVDIFLPREKPLFYRNEDLTFNMKLSRRGHLYCYYKDAKNDIIQIYPNQFQLGSSVNGNTLITIPDSSKMFSIVLSQPGKEEVLCAASSKSLKNLLPDSELFRADLDVIDSVKNLDEVQEILKQIGKDDVYFSRKSWAVVGR